jgi:hypothetical protein
MVLLFQFCPGLGIAFRSQAQQEAAMFDFFFHGIPHRDLQLGFG